MQSAAHLNITEACGSISDEESEGEAELESINDEDLWQFGLTLGIDIRTDVDLIWVVRKAFSAPVLNGWNARFDSYGRAFYVDIDTNETTWLHPADRVFREILSVIKAIRAEPDPMDPEHSPTQQRLVEAIESHLHTMQQRAEESLEEWSGPYDAEDGAGHYYHNSQTGISSWRNPADEWKAEMSLHYSILCRSLLPGVSKKHIAQAAGQISPPGSFGTPFNVSPRARLRRPSCPFNSSVMHTPKSGGIESQHVSYLDERWDGSSLSPISAR